MFRCHVLDELRDTSSDAVRKKQFEELDEDSSGAVDFEEYLSVSRDVLKLTSL